MDIESAWKKIEQNKPELKRELVVEAIRKKSSAPAAKLLRNVKYKILWIVFFCLAFPVTFLFIHEWVTGVFMAIVTLSYYVALVLWVKEHGRLKAILEKDDNLLATLKEYHNRIKHSTKLEEKVAMFLYPISASAGFFFGFFIASEKGEREVFAEPVMLVAWLVTAAVLTPLGHWMAKKMNKKAYGKYIDQLSEQIQQLENEN